MIYFVVLPRTHGERGARGKHTRGKEALGIDQSQREACRERGLVPRSSGTVVVRRPGSVLIASVLAQRYRATLIVSFIDFMRHRYYIGVNIEEAEP